MQKDEKIAYNDLLNKYVENNKVPDIFENLLRELLLHRPNDPIQFLIDKLSQRKRPRLIFIHSLIPVEDALGILGAEYNLKLISAQAIIQDEIARKSPLGLKYEKSTPLLGFGNNVPESAKV